MFGKIGPMELILVLLIALVIFGPSKLPQIGRALGESIKEFKSGTKELRNVIDDAGEPAKTEAPKAEQTAAPAAPAAETTVSAAAAEEKKSE